MLEKEYRKYGKIKFKWFYFRRALRILPLYFLVTGAAALFAIFANKEDALLILIGYWTFTTNLLMGFADGTWNFPYFNHLWSIPYEEQVYLVLPLLILWILRVRNIHFISCALVLIVAIGLGTRAVAIDSGIMKSLGVYLVPLFRPESIICGLICGQIWSRGLANKVNPNIYGVLFFLGLLALWLYTRLYGFDHFHPKYSMSVYLILSLLFSSLLLWVLAPNTLGNLVFSIKPLPWLGKISYGLYVWHLIAKVAAYLYIIVPFDLPRSYEFRFIFYLSSTIAISCASYYLFERWFLLLKDKFQVIQNRDS